MRALTLLAVLALGAHAAAAPLEGDGKPVTQTREVPAFTGVMVDTAAEVAVKVGAAQRVTVTVDSNLQDHVTTEVRRGTLVIDAERSVRPTSRVRVEISVPELREVEVDGSADVTVDGGRGDVALEIDGSGSIRFAGEAGELRVDIEGSGDVTLAGSAKRLRVDVEGSGDVDALELRAHDADVDIEGSGDVAVRLDGGKLRGEVSGSGDITWTGAGSVERAVVSGSGEIRRR